MVTSENCAAIHRNLHRLEMDQQEFNEIQQKEKKNVAPVKQYTCAPIDTLDYP